MSKVNNNYEYLITKLDEFIRKFYKNKLIRGSIYVVAALAAGYIIITVSEYYSYFSSGFRTVIFYSFIGLALLILCFYVLRPLLAYFRLGQVINHNTASEIIGNHFPEIKDKLLNTLQLHNMDSSSAERSSLIEASINQKIEQLRPIPFTSAINLKENKKYIKYALIPVGAILLIGAAAPSILKDGTTRLVNYNKTFERKAPFQFNINNKKLQAFQNEDFTLELKMSGEEIPQDIYLIEGENRYKLDKVNVVNFKYLFKNLQRSQTFQLFADGFYSKEFTLEVLPNPTLINFQVMLIYPGYIKKKNEVVNNTGDLSIPTGTVVSWNFKAANTEKLEMVFDSASVAANRDDDNTFSFSRRFLKSSKYAIHTQNSFVNKKDSLNYTINVTPDLSPSISVQERRDSISNKQFYFGGEIKDDYGFSKLTFNYQILNKDQKQIHSKPIPISLNNTTDRFFFDWNLDESGIEPGAELSYYFEVFDNDAVTGPKSTRSEIHTLTLSTKAEIAQQLEKNSEVLKDKMEDALHQASKLQRDVKKLNDQLADKKSLTFEEKKQVKDLIDKQKQLEDAVKDIQEQNKNNNIQNSEYNEQDQKILEKQKQIEDLFNNVLDEKTKDLLKNLEKLLEENNKNQTREELDNLRMDNKNLEKELDRMLELYKQLEFEQKLQQSIDKLSELSDKQKELSDKSKNQNADNENLKKEQKNINEQFDQLKKDLNDLEKKNEDLQNKNEFESPQEEQKDIQKDLDNSEQNLEKNNKQKASESQKNASQKMKNLSNKMQQAQQQMEGKSLDIDIQSLREILENLLKVSFEQEKLMQQFKALTINDARFNSLAQRQKALKDDLDMVQDSIFSLSKRILEIQSFVNKETESIKTYMDKTMENLADHRIGEAAGTQQYIMTSVNNLAVMLSEILDQLQNQQSSGMGKSKSKNKKPSLSAINKMQEELNKQMQQMKNGMKPGQQIQRGQQSEQIAKMARQQQAIRNALQDINREQNKDGKGKLGDLDKLSKDMEKTESELYNKQLTQEMLKRQQEIKTRLLEAEKAERERDMDEKRDAQQGKDQTADYKKVFEQYQKAKQNELELLKTVPPGINSFYKSKINLYFNLLNNGK